MEWNRKEFIKALGISGLASFFNTGLSYPESSLPSPIKPPRLKEGGTIGLISPASSLAPPLTYEEVIGSIKELGFRVKLGEHYKDSYGDMAGTDEARASDLNGMFADPEVDAIMPFRGGWGSNRILDLVDFKIIRQNPKPLIGFSDITSLLLSIYAETGLITFHGPVAKSIWNEFTLSHFRKAVMGSSAFSMKRPDDYPGAFFTVTGGNATGKLLGGNLTVLTSMLGSGYLPDWEGCILFVEDVGEGVYRIDRMLTQLGLNGILSQLNGFLFSDCTDCNKGNVNSHSLEQVLADHIKPLQIPAFYGSMIGHIDKMFTVPIGIDATINADTGALTLLEVPTSANS